MIIDLTDRELSAILEGLDNAIECIADWSEDELDTARDRRDIRRKTRKFWRLVKKLIVYAPNHYMAAVSVKGASRGSGATVTLNRTELGSNGPKPVATKLTNNGAGTNPPVTCATPPLKGGRRGASGGSEAVAMGSKRVPSGKSGHIERIRNVGYCESGMTGNGSTAGFSETGPQTNWRRFDIRFGLTEATPMPRHKGSKDLKPRAQQRAARPRGIPLTEGIGHQPRREFIVSSSVRRACEKYLANPQPHHNPRGPILRQFRVGSASHCE
jgi:hypothetical protein